MSSEQLAFKKLKEKFDKLELDAKNMKINDKEYTFTELTPDEIKLINAEKEIINRIYMISKRYDSMVT